jgi:hypothetical protein
MHLDVVSLLEEVPALLWQQMQQAGWVTSCCASIVSGVRAGCVVHVGVVAAVRVACPAAAASAASPCTAAVCCACD